MSGFGAVGWIGGSRIFGIYTQVARAPHDLFDLVHFIFNNLHLFQLYWLASYMANEFCESVIAMHIIFYVTRSDKTSLIAIKVLS